MLLQNALEADYPEIVALANVAFRGTGPAASWNSEADIVDGQRLSESLLREDIAKAPNVRLLLYREKPEAEILGTVLLEPRSEEVWYLGLLTVHPEMQSRKLGRRLLSAAEDIARDSGVQRIRLSTVQLRHTLIAWYERRGYSLTGETLPFPYGDQRFGTPLRDDLHFVVMEKNLNLVTNTVVMGEHQ